MSEISNLRREIDDLIRMVDRLPSKAYWAWLMIAFFAAIVFVMCGKIIFLD